MKAIEYAEKYKQHLDPAITDETKASLMRSIAHEMFDEMQDLVSKRHIKTDSAFDSLLREFNQKGNKINNELGNPFMRNWFICLWDELSARVKTKV